MSKRLFIFIRGLDKQPTMELIGDGHDLFIVLDGIRVAKRSYPNSPQARTWIALEPGWRVTGTLEQIKISYDPPTAH